MSSLSLSTILRDHVTLSITSFDRLYLGGYLPSLQASGQLVTFCQQRLNAPIASPALFGPLTDRFIKAVQQFAGQHDVPVIHFVRGQRKDDVAARYRARFTANEGVVFIGIAQEKMNALSDPRVLALLQALCQVAPRPGGFRHRDLRPIVAGLLGRDLAQYSAGAMTYDLRRLRLHSLIQRVPHSFRYTLTTDGLRLAFGISRIVLRLLQPGWDDLLRSDLNLPTPLREALLRLEAALHSFADTDCPPAKAA